MREKTKEGIELKMTCLRKGIYQYELAKMVGISPSLISKATTGERHIKEKKKKIISNILNGEWAEIFPKPRWEKIELKIALVEKNMKENELAKKLGVTPEYISNVIGGIRELSYLKQVEVSKILDTPRAVLFK